MTGYHTGAPRLRLRHRLSGVRARLPAALTVIAGAAGAALAPAAAGDVSDQGAFQTSVEIEVPPFRGLEPEVALRYESTAGDGLLGVGWRLDAGSYITRAGHTGGTPRHDGRDHFLLDGAELFACGNDCPLGGTHEPRERDFWRLQLRSDQRWTRWRRDGVRDEYERMPIGMGPGGAAYKWALRFRTDTHGNTVAYEHSCDDAECYLDWIAYEAALVDFHYETRGDTVSYATGADAGEPAAVAQTTKRLKTIEVRFGGGLVRAYALGYAQSRASSGSLLRSVQLFGSDATVDAAGNVTRGPTPPQPKTTFAAPAMTGPGVTLERSTRMMDGLLEIGPPGLGDPDYKPVYGGDTISYDNAGATDPDGNVTGPSLPQGDFDGDGRLDVAVVSVPGYSEVEVATLLSNRVHDTPNRWRVGDIGGPLLTAYTADLNADGRDDLTFSKGSLPSPQTLTFYWALSDGDGTFRTQDSWKLETQIANNAECSPGDLDGDGLSDLACKYTDAETRVTGLGVLWQQPDGEFDDTYQTLPGRIASPRDVEFAVADVDSDSDEEVLLAVRVPKLSSKGQPLAQGTWRLITRVFDDRSQYREQTAEPGWTWDDAYDPQDPETYDWALSAGDFDGDGRRDWALTRTATRPRDDVNGIRAKRLAKAFTYTARSVKGVAQPVNGPLVQTQAFDVIVGDRDGNGLDDLLTRGPRGEAMASGGGDFAGWKPVAEDDSACANDDGWIDNDESATDTGGDLNGDGRYDRLCVNLESVHGPEPKAWASFRDVPALNTPTPQWGWMSADVTGNGLADLVRVHHRNPGYQIYTLRARPGGGYTRTEPQEIPADKDKGLLADHPGTAAWMAADVGGGPGGRADGRADLVLVDGGPRPRVYTLLSHSLGWEAEAHRIEKFLGYDPGAFTPAQLDRDGRTDLVRVRRLSAGQVRVEALMSNGDGTWTERGRDHFVYTPPDPPPDPPPAPPPVIPRPFQTLDMNGDGLTDLLQVDPGPVGGEAGKPSFRALLSDGDGTFSEHAEALPFNDKTRPEDRRAIALDLRPMEVNGDGVSDLAAVQPATSPDRCLTVHALESAGNDFIEARRLPPAVGPGCPAGVADTDNVQIADVNADNRDDILHLSTWSAPERFTGTRTAVHVLVNHPGREWTALDESALPFAHRRTWAYFQTDPDQDGRGDWAYAGEDLDLLGFATRSELLTGSANGHGASTRIDYKLLDAHRDYLPPGSLPQLVDAVTVTDAAHDPPVSERTEHGYDGARWSDEQRRLLGFAQTTRTTRRAVTETASRLTERCGAQPETVTLGGTGGATYKRTTHELAPPGEKPPYLCRADTVTETETGGGEQATHSSGFERDRYGNVTATIESATDAPRRRTLTDFQPNAGPRYIVSLPARERVQHADKGEWKTVSLTENIYDKNIYDTNTAWDQPPGWLGELRRVRRHDDHKDRFVETGSEYDPRGNLRKTTDPAGRVTTIEPDKVHRLFPATRCDPIGCTHQEWHERFPVIKTATDLNGRITVHEHDAFGRPVKTTEPDGATTTTAYLSDGSWTGTPAQRRRVRTERSDASPGDGYLWREELLDGLGRVYRTTAEGGPEGDIVTATRYVGASERPEETSAPHYVNEPAAWTHYAYDDIDRPETVTMPGGRTSSTDYKGGRTIDHDPVGRTSTTVRDGYGRTVRVEQADRAPCPRCPPLTTTHYIYDALDRRTRIDDPAGRTTSTVFDSLGRVLHASDPDGGTRSWEYHDDGTPESSTDQLGQRTTWQYDHAGRQQQRVERRTGGAVARTVNWTWDRDPQTKQTSGDSVGRLIRSGYGAAGASGSIDLRYDSRGRVDQSRECVQGSCVSLGFEFDPAGRLQTLTYPDAAGNLSAASERLVHGYDDAGQLWTLTGQDGVRYAQLTYTAREQVETLTHNDGTTDRATYHPDRHWLTRLRVSPARRGRSLLDTRYTHYDDGRVETATEYRPDALGQRYVYDDHARLRRVNATQPSRDRRYDYDPSGRLGFSSTAGTFRYGDSEHPHAPTSTTRGHLRRYDRNGQLTRLRDPRGRDLTLRWTVSGHPQQITDRARKRTTELGYDADDRRVLRRARGGRPHLYFGTYVERDRAGRLIRNYWAGDRLAARRDGAGAVTSLHADHLGSTRLTTGPTGRVSGRYDYDPYGRRLPGRGPRRDQRLFYGQPHDEETGLTYMNARYYDPELARFISRDSIIPDPYRPQSLDRYAYVEGDPVNYTDPTGHMSYSDGVHGDAPGGLLGWLNRGTAGAGCETPEQRCERLERLKLADEIYQTKTPRGQLDLLADVLLTEQLSLVPGDADVAAAEAEESWTLAGSMQSAAGFLEGAFHGLAGFGHSFAGTVGVALGVVDEVNFEYAKEQWAERGQRYSAESRAFGEQIGEAALTKGAAGRGPRAAPGQVIREVQGPLPGTAAIYQTGRHVGIEVSAGGRLLGTEQLVFDDGGTTIAKMARPVRPDRVVRIDLPDARAAMAYQQSVLGKPLGQYHGLFNSCVTHCANVLRAGGVNAPNTTLNFNRWFKRR